MSSSSERPITARQLAVLECICRYITENGRPPSMREVGQQLNIDSTNAVNDHFRYLERKGYITRTPGKARSIRLTPRALRRVGLTHNVNTALILRGHSMLSEVGQVLSFKVTPQAVALLEKLVATGLYGATVNEVAERLFFETLRECSIAMTPGADEEA